MEGDLAQLADQAYDLAKSIDDSLGRLPSLAVTKGGEILLTELFKSRVKIFFRKFNKAKSEGQIPPDFDDTEHGKTLLQEALDALWQARDKERAEAIQKVFLGLAMNPVEISLEQIEQLEIIRLASELTTWEVAFCNALERYSKLAYMSELAQQRQSYIDNGGGELSSEKRSQLHGLIKASKPSFQKWLKEYCCGDPTRLAYLQRANDSLHTKMILRVPHHGMEENLIWSALERRGAFTEFGWKLAQYLYLAKVPTEVEAI